MGYLPNKYSWTFNLIIFLILESLNEIWESFDVFALRCYNKRQGRKLRPLWRQNTLPKRVKFAHKYSIYSQYFSLNSQCKACSFYLSNEVHIQVFFQLYVFALNYTFLHWFGINWHDLNQSVCRNCCLYIIKGVIGREISKSAKRAAWGRFEIQSTISIGNRSVRGKIKD